MPKAPPSSRAYEYAMFSFGLVSIPLAVFSSTNNDHGISRKMVRPVPRMVPKLDANDQPVLDPTTQEPVLEHLHVPKLDDQDPPQPVLDDAGQPVLIPVYDDHPVGYASWDKEEQAVVSSGEVVKKIETEHGLVYVEPHELEQLFNLDPKTIRVLSFQPQHLFYSGAYVPKKQYFVEAERTKVGKARKQNKAADKALAMVFKAMKAEGAVALVEFTTRGVPQPAVILPNGVMWTVHYEEELREQRPLPEIEVEDAYVAQARMLIKQSWSDEPRELSDKRTALIQGFADEKAAAGDFARPDEDVVVEGLGEATDDLMAALMASMGGGTATGTAATA